MSALESILSSPIITHDLEQGSPEWDAFRLLHRGASEAAAMLGLSKNVTRTELLHAKHTGIAREFSDFVQKRILDKGHEVEALARPIIEDRIAEDLYPATCSRGPLSASCDGITLDNSFVFEHKQWNEALAASVRAGLLPDEHMPQCQQIMLVTGAVEVEFVVSDGTPDKMVSMLVNPDRAWWERIANGWEQFHRDLETFTPAPAAPVVVAEPVQALPAVVVQVSGSIDVRDNFKAFETALRDFLDNHLIRAPKTDQDFADLDVQIKAMKGAEAALEGAEAQMLAQVQTIDTAKKTKDMLHKLVRDNRLMAEKLLASEKERRRAEIVQAGRAEYDARIEALKRDTGGPWIMLPGPDFAGKVKGLRTITSIQNAVDTELANATMAANDSARKIRAALSCIAEEGVGYEFLLADKLSLISKPVEDLRTLIQARITTHREKVRADAEAAAEKERDRIRKEEQERADKEARDRLAAEQEQARQAAEAAKPAPTPAPVVVAPPAAPPVAVSYPPLTAERATADGRPAPAVVPIRAPAAPASPPTLTLGAISERLGFAVTADFAKRMGFEGTKVRSSTLFHEADVSPLIDSIVAHLRAVQHELQAA